AQWAVRALAGQPGEGGPVAQIAAMTGTDVATYTRERPGISAFVLEDGGVYHTYSAYARGVDGLWGMYQWLDRAPKGRNETGVWRRRHDEYDKRSTNMWTNCGRATHGASHCIDPPSTHFSELLRCFSLPLPRDA